MSCRPGLVDAWKERWPANALTTAGWPSAGCPWASTPSPWTTAAWTRKTSGARARALTVTARWRPMPRRQLSRAARRCRTDEPFRRHPDQMGGRRSMAPQRCGSRCGAFCRSECWRICHAVSRSRQIGRRFSVLVRGTDGPPPAAEAGLRSNQHLQPWPVVRRPLSNTPCKRT